jgi:DNA topoisomerase VI subunit B
MEILNHIRKNFVLFGLGSEESAIIQCVRELFENSKDAIKKMHLISNSKLFDGEIIIRLNNDQEIHNQIILTVEDNGIGMESPISCLLCFNSLRVHDLSQEETKEVSNKLELNGKYGIGLSACVLYSQLKSLGPYVHITSKFINKNYVETFDFKFDLSSGYPEVIQSNVVDMNINHGTLVKMMLPMNFKHRNFEKIHEALYIYIFRTQILPTNRCSIRFILKLEFKDQNGENFRSERKDVLHKAKNLDFKKDSFTEEEYKSMLVENFKSSIKKTESCKISGVSFVEDESGNSIKASAILITDKTKNNRADGSFKPVSFELQIWRFVNGTPLLDFVNDTVSCELFKSVTSINWTEYGHKLNFSMNGSKTGNNSINLGESYELKLTPINEEYLPDELGILIPNVLIFFLDYNSDEGLTFKIVDLRYNFNFVL